MLPRLRFLASTPSERIPCPFYTEMLPSPSTWSPSLALRQTTNRHIHELAASVQCKAQTSISWIRRRLLLWTLWKVSVLKIRTSALTSPIKVHTYPLPVLTSRCAFTVDCSCLSEGSWSIQSCSRMWRRFRAWTCSCGLCWWDYVFMWSKHYAHINSGRHIHLRQGDS